MLVKYLIINPYHNASHGIANYINSIKKIIDGLEVIVYENKKNLSPTLFREDVYNYVTTKFGVNDVIIEAPEAKAATLLIPSSYNVHIRLHCPLAIAQKYDLQNPNQGEYSNELRVISKAKVVSSPSYALYREMQNELKNKPDFFFKNPIDPSIPMIKDDKKYDVIFMGRFQELKGISHINKILELLPSSYNALLFGPNSSAFKLSSKVSCNVVRKGQVLGEEKLKLIRSAKCLMLPSQFENCSMVILEALGSCTPVVCWDVGGNSEIATPKVLRTAKFGNHDEFAFKIKSFVENQPDFCDFEHAAQDINTDFNNGLKSLLLYINEESTIKYNGFNNSEKHIYTPYHKDTPKLDNNKLRVFGVAFSNEHIEELWAPIISYLGYDYRYACRRPLGHHSVFKHEPFPINKKWVCCFDWIKESERLIQQIKNYRPNFILFHNGSHPVYLNVLEQIKALRIPIVYSELGWFPQKDHVYFDAWGVNGKSYIASQNAEQLCNKSFEEPTEKTIVCGDYALIITQLENDTNLIVNSPLFKNNESFIEHIIKEIGDKTKIIIKPHPLDKNNQRYQRFENESVSLINDIDTNTLIHNAHSVIGINSTVLVQALEYPVNIYSFGYSILDNKGVSINCLEQRLSHVWRSELFGSMNKRLDIINALKNKQINLLEVRNNIPPQIEALSPLYNNHITDFSHLITKETNKSKSNNKEELQFESHVIRSPMINPQTAKLAKLRKKPALFFIDFIKKRINKSHSAR